MPNWEIIAEALQKFPQLRLLVVGDLMVDEFIWGKAGRISPEAPVPVVSVIKESKLLGGAANVARNIMGAGCLQVDLLGLRGDDQVGLDLENLMKDLNFSVNGLIVEKNRPTTIKTRVVAQGQQMIRYDREITTAPAKKTEKLLLDVLSEKIKKADVVVVSDYNKGLITAKVMELLVSYSQKGLPVLVDPKVPNINLYKGVTAITPNHHEAKAVTGVEIDSDLSLIKAGNKLLKDLALKALLVTRGEAGMSLLEPGGKVTHIPTVAKQVFDVTGAGDTAISLWALALGSGLDFVQAAYLANLGAGIVVGQVGTSVIAKDELEKALQYRIGKHCGKS